ncbi:MAG: hypothetical protein P8N31_12240, partial [Planctomycetota bacterium]|nr:hypothetical protein [Planctomycetota bacterium]
PTGFAARVAQAAFHGGPAQRQSTPKQPAPVTAQAQAPQAKPETSVQSFVLVLTSIAAALLISLSFLIGIQDQPRGSNLSAQPMPDLLPEVLRGLDELNARDVRLEKARGEREIEKEQGLLKR